MAQDPFLSLDLRAHEQLAIKVDEGRAERILPVDAELASSVLQYLRSGGDDHHGAQHDKGSENVRSTTNRESGEHKGHDEGRRDEQALGEGHLRLPAPRPQDDRHAGDDRQVGDGSEPALADDRGKGQAHCHESARPELGRVVRSLEPWPWDEHEVDIGEGDVHASDRHRDLRPPGRARGGKGNEADNERRGGYEQGDVAGPDIRVADEARIVEPPVPVEVRADPAASGENHRSRGQEGGKAHGKADERGACIDDEPMPASLALGDQPHRAHREPHRERKEERIGVEHDEPAGDDSGDRARQPSRLRPTECAPGGEGEEQCRRGHDRAREIRVAHIAEDHRVE